MKLFAIFIILMGCTLNTFAKGFDPAPIRVTDGFSIVPQVEAGLRYDDNIYNQEDDTTSSSIYIVKPSLKFGVDDGINRYGGIYQLTSATYSNGSDDDYVDHYLSLLAHTEYSDKHRTDFKFSFANLHEDRGSGLSEGNSSAISEPLKYNELVTSGYYQYGGMDALMRIGGGVFFTNTTYQNFKATTKYDDVNELKFLFDADYQVGDVTYLTFDLYTTDIQYAHLEAGEDSSDNLDSRALIGFKWAGLRKTIITMKTGYQYKTFESDNRENFSGNTFEIGINWKPREYSSFIANFSREAQDSSTDGDYILELESSIKWKHEWTDDFYSTINFVYTDEDYIGFTRNDRTRELSLDLNYDLTRWMQIKAGYEFTNKNSNQTDISYDENIVNLGVVVAL